MFDIDKLNMFFYNYDENMNPILSEDQIIKEWAKQQDKNSMKAILDADTYLNRIQKGIDNKKEALQSEFEYIKSNKEDNKTEIENSIKELNEELNKDFKNIDDVKKYSDSIATKVKENNIAGLANEYKQFTGQDFYDLAESSRKAYVEGYGKEYIPELNEEYKIIRLKLRELFSNISENKIDYENLNELKKIKDRLIKSYKTRKNNVTKDYWNSLPEKDKLTKSVKQNQLLNSEINILLNPANYWQIRMPLGDEYLKGTLLPFMTKKVEKWAKDNTDLVYIEDSESSYSQVLTPSLNIIKTILYLQGKAGVGVFALQGTNHSISGHSPMKINDEYIDTAFNFTAKSTKNEQVQLLSSLPFDKKFYKNHLSSITTYDGQTITELISQLLTSQVDIGKNPYPASMGIILENLGFISYLLRRGVPIELGLQLVQHPVVKRFTKFRSSKESIYSKSLRLDSGRNSIIKEYLDKLKYDDAGLYNNIKTLSESYVKIEDKYTTINTVSRVNNKVKLNTRNNGGLEEIIDETKEDQANILLSYFQIMEQSTEYSDFIRYSRFDTQTFKNREEYLVWNKSKEKVFEVKFFTEKTLKNFDENSLISSFKSVKDNYAIFDNLYFDNLTNGALSNMTKYFYMKNNNERIKLTSKLNSDFITYIVQNYMPKYLQDKNIVLDNIEDTVNEFIKDIDVFKNSHKDNYFLKRFNLIKGLYDGLSVFYTKDRVRNAGEINNMLVSLDEIKSIDKSVYEKIILLPFLTSGLATGRFNYQDVLNQDERFNLIYESLLEYIGKEIPKDITDDFLVRFAKNNSYLLNRRSYEDEEHITYVSYYDENLPEDFQNVKYIKFPDSISTTYKDNKLYNIPKTQRGLINYLREDRLPTVQLPVGQKELVDEFNPYNFPKTSDTNPGIPVEISNKVYKELGMYGLEMDYLNNKTRLGNPNYKYFTKIDDIVRANGQMFLNDLKGVLEETDINKLLAIQDDVKKYWALNTRISTFDWRNQKSVKLYAELGIKINKTLEEVLNPYLEKYTNTKLIRKEIEYNKEEWDRVLERNRKLNEKTKEIPESMKVFYNLNETILELDANKAEYRTEQSFGITSIYNKKNKLIATFNSLGRLATTAQLKDVTIDDMAKDLHDLACG